MRIEQEFTKVPEAFGKVIDRAARGFIIGEMIFFPFEFQYQGESQYELVQANVSKSKPFNEVSSLSLDNFQYNKESLIRAVNALLRFQPEGTYILTNISRDDIVHMDIAHAVIAFSKIKYVDQAKGAMNWLLSKTTIPQSKDRFENGFDYSGSWYDHFNKKGKPNPGTRGRGEGVGMSLVAIGSICQEDPDYLFETVNGKSVYGYMKLMVGYLGRIQAEDGNFYHNPNYPVSFIEENTRMAEGLEIAYQSFLKLGDFENAALAKRLSDKGFAAIKNGTNMKKGMPFDYFGKLLWNVEGGEKEIDIFRKSGLIVGNDVRNWDWQENTNEDFKERLKYFVQGLFTTTPSIGMEYADALLTIGRIKEASMFESRARSLQKSDGSFSAIYVTLLGWGLGEADSYAISRYIIMEAMFNQVINENTSLK